MKLLLVLTILSTVSISVFATEQTRVRGYTKKDGTYVPSYERTKPDGSKTNNFSTKGNTNPYTGKEGTK